MTNPLPLALTKTGDGPPVVILHGLMGQARNWGMVAKALSGAFTIYTPDLRNHGASPWDVEMNYPAMAADLATLMRQEAIEGAAVIGHSMGGKAAMELALRHGDKVGRLGVVDIAPVTYGSSFLPYVRAMKAIDLSQITRRSEADRALADSVPQAGVRGFLLQNLLKGEDGVWRWHINLDALETNMSLIGSFPDHGGDRYDGPTLFVAGGLSDYITPDSEPAIRALFPQANIVTIEGAGHWVHAEKPAEIVTVLQDFLAL